MTLMTRTVRMDSKHRPTLPLDLLKAAGIRADEDLVASTNGDGTVTLRSQSSNVNQIRGEITAGFRAGGPSQKVPSLREDRDADDEAIGKRVASESADPDAARAALMARLGR